jgi:hypothetical protein
VSIISSRFLSEFRRKKKPVHFAIMCPGDSVTLQV